MFGADFKLGLTSDLTLTGTVNPDFGQVEADPSQVNLTGGETFFAERRPFFTEGLDLFQFTWLGRLDLRGRAALLLEAHRQDAAARLPRLGRVHVGRRARRGFSRPASCPGAHWAGTSAS